jgi:hypothetical protein
MIREIRGKKFPALRPWHEAFLEFKQDEFVG